MGVVDWFNNLVGGARAVVPVQESLPAFDYADPDLLLPGEQNAQNWRRLTQTGTDLSPLTHERMQSMALYLSDRNPLAKGAVDVMTAFIVGEGFTVTSKDEEVQAAIDRFWEDAQNDMDSRMEDYTRELSIFGEQIFLAFVNDRSGRVALVTADPQTVTAVRSHPLASDRPYAVCFGSAVAASEQRWVKIIVEDDDPTSASFGRMIGQRPGDRIKVGDESVEFYQPKTEGSVYLAGCFFTAINKPRSAMRGRSDLLPVADFVDLYDRLIFDEAERMSFLRAYVWDVTTKGLSQDQVRSRASEIGLNPPKPGSVQVHNESEEWKSVSPDLNSDDSQNTADLILSLVATGVGLPKTWLNGIMDANRATASEMSDPAIKRLTARQRVVARTIEHVIRFVLDCAEAAGALPRGGDERHAFTVSTPEMSSKDLERAARSLITTTQAMGMANAAGWIDNDTAQDGVALMLGQLGMDVDVPEMRDRIAAAKAEGSDDGYEIPDYFGVGKSMGPDNLTRAMRPAGEDEEGPVEAPAVVLSPQGKDVASVISSLSKSLVELGNAGVIDGEFAQEVVARLFATLGIEVDIAAMQQRLEDARAAAQAPTPAPPGGGAPETGFPTSADELIDLDELALEEADRIGARYLDSLDSSGDAREVGLTLLAEAFDAALHPRGPGGKFAPKSADATDGPVAEAEAQALELARELIAKQKAKAERRAKDPNAPPKPPSAMNASEMKSAIAQLQPGAEVNLKLSNGLEIRGTVDVKSGDVVMVKTPDGQYAALHPGLKGLAQISSGDMIAGPGPRAPREPRAPRQPKAPGSRSESAKKAAATRAAKKAAAAAGEPV